MQRYAMGQHDTMLAAQAPVFIEFLKLFGIF
jgi:hypothetical protein